MTDRLTIRRERVTDHEAIDLVVGAAFDSGVETQLVHRIRTSPEYVPELALVAEVDGKIVGHVMISGAVIRGVAGDRPIVMLAPLAVAPAWQRRGIGAALVEEVVGLADRRSEPLVVLEGSPAYYSRFGFVHSVEHGIEMTLPEWAPSEAGQVRLLSSYDPCDASLRGLVVYPPAFDGVE